MEGISPIQIGMGTQNELLPSPSIFSRSISSTSQELNVSTNKFLDSYYDGEYKELLDDTTTELIYNDDLMKVSSNLHCYMNQSIASKAISLNKRIVELSSLIKAHYQLKFDAFHPIYLSSHLYKGHLHEVETSLHNDEHSTLKTEDFIVKNEHSTVKDESILKDELTLKNEHSTVKDELILENENLRFTETPFTGVYIRGRICSEQANGKLDQNHVILEGCMEVSRGKRIQLDFSQMNAHYSLFPGQVTQLVLYDFVRL